MTKFNPTRRLKKSWLHYIAALALGFSPASAEMAWAAGSCVDKIINHCQQLASTAAAPLFGVTPTGNAANDTKNLRDTTSLAGASSAQAAQQCAEDSKDICSKSNCQNKDELVRSCMEAATTQASRMQTQSDQLNQNSGDAGKTLMGLAAMGGMAAMMMMMNKKNQQQQPPPQPTYGALQANGSLNCAMADSYKYLDCDGYLTNACAGYGLASAAPAAPSMPMTGTVIAAPGGVAAQPDCASFVNRYCSSTPSPAQGMGNLLPNGTMTQVNIAGTGEGYGQGFCQKLAAQQWCSDPTYGASRQSCSTCRSLVSAAGATCALHPEMCLAQNSNSITDGPNCSSEPVLGPTAGAPAVAGAATGAPAVAGPATAVASVSTSTAVSASGAPIGAANSVASSGSSGGVGFRPSGPSAVKVQSVAVGAARGAGGSVGSLPGGGTFQPSSVGPEDLAAAGGVIVAKTANVSRGPASDVQAAYGPSVFAMSTQVYRQRCQAGKLNNCP